MRFSVTFFTGIFEGLKVKSIILNLEAYALGTGPQYMKSQPHFHHKNDEDNPKETRTTKTPNRGRILIVQVKMTFILLMSRQWTVPKKL